MEPKLNPAYKIAQQYVMCFKESYPNILEDLQNAHYYNRSVFADNPYETARREGERNVILRIMTIIDMTEKGEITNE